MTEHNIIITLTSSGMNFFIQRNMKIFKFANPEGGIEYGISLDTFSPAFIQKMLLEGFISKIEVSSIEFTSRRQEITDLTKLIVYGILYKQFDTIVYNEKILQSKLVKDHNRTKPGNLIDERTQFDRRVVEAFLKGNKEKIDSIKKSVLSPVIVRLQSETGLNPEERKKKYMICEKFLDNLYPKIWYILLNFQTTREFVLLLADVRNCLIEYLDKTTVAESLALMLIELLNYAQNTNIQNFIQKRFSNTISLQTLVSDPNLRHKVITEMEKHNEKLYLTWKIIPQVSATTERNKLEVTVFNRESEYQKFKQEIDDKKDINLNKKNIVDFCKETPDNLFNPELGFLYISYLSDECKRVNIRFDSFVHQLKNSDFTVITSNLNF